MKNKLLLCMMIYSFFFTMQAMDTANIDNEEHQRLLNSSFFRHFSILYKDVVAEVDTHNITKKTKELLTTVCHIPESDLDDKLALSKQLRKLAESSSNDYMRTEGKTVHFIFLDENGNPEKEK